MSVEEYLNLKYAGNPVAIPQLRIAYAEGVMTASWPLSAEGFVLDQAMTLSGSSIPWTPLLPPYASNATHYYMALPAPTDNRFYGLHSP